MSHNTDITTSIQACAWLVCLHHTCIKLRILICPYVERRWAYRNHCYVCNTLFYALSIASTHMDAHVITHAYMHKYSTTEHDPKKAGDQHVCINDITVKETNTCIGLCLRFRSICTYTDSIPAFWQVDIPFSWLAFKAAITYHVLSMHGSAKYKLYKYPSEQGIQGRI